jgi:hypothetical protein
VREGRVESAYFQLKRRREISEAQFSMRRDHNIDDGMLRHISKNALILIDQVQKQKEI